MHREPQLNNAALMARRQAAVARGVGHAHEIFADRAVNAEVWDVEGRRFIDFAGGGVQIDQALGRFAVVRQCPEHALVQPPRALRILSPGLAQACAL